MSKIYTDLNTVLTPYATAIKKNASDIDELNGSLGNIHKTKGTFREYTDFVFGMPSAGQGHHPGYSPSRLAVVSPTGFVVDRDIIFEVDEGWTCSIYYFDLDYDTWIKTLSATSESPIRNRVITAGSYITVQIHRGSAGIPQNMFDTAINAVKIQTKYADIKNDIAILNSDSEVAEMYLMGNAPKTHEQTGIGIICAGQSQMAGSIPVADLPSDIVLPMSNAYNINTSTGAISNLNVQNNWSVEIPIFDKLSDIGIAAYRIKEAVGNTAIYIDNGSVTSNWYPWYEKTVSAGKTSLLRYLENAIRLAISNHSDKMDIRAFIWMQGEADRTPPANINYYHGLKCLIAYVRGVVGNSKLPFICGTVSRLSSQYDKIVEQATKKVCEEDDNAVCIDMCGAPLLSDGLHLNAESAVYFGHMAFDALVDFGIVNAEKIEPVKPWSDYTISGTYTNCTSNNAITTVPLGDSYDSVIVADEGYAISNVSVTMGGTEITDYVYNSGKIHIDRVRGNLVITASAVEG